MARKIWIFIDIILTICAVNLGSSTTHILAQHNETFDTQPVEAILGQKGDPITFSYSDKYEKERQIVRRVLEINSEEISPDKMDKEEIGIALRDINNDGKDEILVCFPPCNSRFTSYTLMHNVDGTWRVLDQMSTIGAAMIMLNTKSHGYYDIRFDTETFDPNKKAETRNVLRFGGRTYRPYVTRTRVYDYREETETISTSLFNGRTKEWRVVLP